MERTIGLTPIPLNRKLNAQFLSYIRILNYEDEKDKYVKENYTTDSSSSNNANADFDSLKDLHEKLTSSMSQLRPKKSFNIVLFIVLFFVMPPFAIFYLIFNITTNSK